LCKFKKGQFARVEGELVKVVDTRWCWDKYLFNIAVKLINTTYRGIHWLKEHEVSEVNQTTAEVLFGRRGRKTG
jgi:hypothetical protein